MPFTAINTARAARNTVFYPANEYSDLLVLHELAHAILGHVDYASDVELISLETAAWTRAKTLATKYRVSWDKNYAEAHLDTYRNWLAARSTCPRCTTTGYQTPDGLYHCSHCLSNWKSLVNRRLL